MNVLQLRGKAASGALLVKRVEKRHPAALFDHSQAHVLCLAAPVAPPPPPPRMFRS